MNFSLRIPLQTTAEQSAKLQDLQRVFALACNALAPMVQGTSCWNRVALHHMAYKQLRQQFPELGSQMVCNAIYSVSRTCRIIYQHPQSPFNSHQRAGKPLPRVHFLRQSPVYFDRHTLSLKKGVVSMLTLDGRMRFNLPLAPADEQRFREHKLREIVLTGPDGQFTLTFLFAAEGEAEAEAATAANNGAAMQPAPAQAGADVAALAEYVLIVDAAVGTDPKDLQPSGLSGSPLIASQAAVSPTAPSPANATP